jgi:hypothetical protein
MLVLVGALAAGEKAFANGDPASDVLPAREIFLPNDPELCSPAARRLAGVVEGAREARYLIKVAVIPTRQDLGLVPALFGHPQDYAAFLARELPPQQFKDGSYRLLIVMPQGLGLYNGGAKERAALVPLSARLKAGDLALSAITALRKLAQAAGRPVKAARLGPSCPGGGSSDDSSSGTSILLFAAPGILLLLAGLVAGLTRRRPRGAGQSG